MAGAKTVLQWLPQEPYPHAILNPTVIYALFSDLDKAYVPIALGFPSSLSVKAVAAKLSLQDQTKAATATGGNGGSPRPGQGLAVT